MPDIAGAPVFSFIDFAWQTVFRLGFPVARLWWRLRRAQHQGALVAVYAEQSLLLLRSPYRGAWNFPGGGVRPGEMPEAAARRELAEEIGLVWTGILNPAGSFIGLWDGRRDHVHIFELHLKQLPGLRLDNREIVAARLALPHEVAATRVTGPVAAYLKSRAATGLVA